MPLRSLLSVLALVLALGAAPAAAHRRRGVRTEFVVQRDRVLVGDFGGYGGQLNQHVYAKISGPPPRSPSWRRRSSRSGRSSFASSSTRPNGRTRTAWTRSCGRSSSRARGRGDQHHVAGEHVRVRDAEHAAIRRRARCSRAAPRHRAPLGDDVQRAEHDRRTLAEYEQVYRSLHRLLVERGVRDRIRFMGGDLTRSEQGPSQAEWLRYMASHMGDLLDAWSVHVYWDFWDTDKIDERLLRRSAKHREHHSRRAAPPPVRHRVRRPRPRDVRGRGELRSRLLARRHRNVGDGDERVPACVVQHPRRAARLLGHGQVGRVPGQVRRGHTGLLHARPGRRGLAGATRLQPPATADADDRAARRAHRRGDGRRRRGSRKAA